MVRVVGQVPRRKVAADELRLPVSRRQEDDEPMQAPLCDLDELVVDQVKVPGSLPAAPAYDFSEASRRGEFPPLEVRGEHLADFIVRVPSQGLLVKHQG